MYRPGSSGMADGALGLNMQRCSSRIHRDVGMAVTAATCHHTQSTRTHTTPHNTTHSTTTPLAQKANKTAPRSRHSRPHSA